MVRVSDGDLIALDTGLRVRLAEIEAPSRPYRDREGEPFADEAGARLEEAVLGRQCQLFYGGLSRDPYDRAIAHVIATDELGRKIWANGFQIRQGCARVRTWPDNAARASELLALEAEARAASRGLWATPYYALRRPQEMGESAGRFALVEGRARVVEDAFREEGTCRPSGDGLVLELGARLRRLRDTDELPQDLRVRIRGRVRDDNGFHIPLTHWAQIERLDVGESL